jgi:hypothetical protein
MIAKSFFVNDVVHLRGLAKYAVEVGGAVP